jgi:DivIVA domain-containing protein
MAISFSRPDPSSPAAVAEAAFGTARRGFDQQEVRDFLRMVAAELARLQERERFLERELRTAQQQAPAAAGSTPAIDEETVTRLLGAETARILTIARESAGQIKVRAEEGAARLLREATDEATRAREEAEVEAARRRSDAAADADAELAMAKQQGRETVEEARAYRERVLGELARRRELARQQIDQLIHGRDRLVQAFERARLVAADVVAELTPLQEPDEYVDLTPTTGPVPLTVKAGQLADQSSIGDQPMPGEVDLDADNPFVTDATGPIAIDADSEANSGTVDPATPSAEPESIVEELEDAERDDEIDGPEDAVDDGEVVAASEDDLVTAASAPVGTSDTAETAETVDTAEAEPQPVDADEAVTAETTGGAAPHPLGSANVLQFPTPPATDEGIEDDDVTATDVDDLFARLRAGQDAPSSDAPSSDVTSSDVDVDAAASEVAAGTGDADDAGVGATGDEDTPFAAREAAIVPLIVAGARKLKRALADEQNEVLDALRRKEPVRTLDVLVPWESAQSERYADAVTPELVAAAEAGASSMGGSGPLDVGPAGVLAPAREVLASDLVVPLRERLLRAVDDADGDNDVIAKKVRGIYREWKTQRIDEHLDDLFRAAYARAAFQAIEPGRRVRWIVDPDGPPSPDCEDNSLEGPVIVGDSFPTGHACPPSHPGCRCLLGVDGE